MDMKPYAHLGMDRGYPSNWIVRRKFRWVARLFKTGRSYTTVESRQELGRAQFVKVSHRPEFEPDRDNPTMPDLEHSFPLTLTYYRPKDFTDVKEVWTRCELENFDEFTLTLHDGHGCALEKWDVGDIRKIQISEDADEEDDIFTIAFECVVWGYRDLWMESQKLESCLKIEEVTYLDKAKQLINVM